MSHLSVICSGAVLYNSVFSHGAQESNHAVSGQSAGQDGSEQHPEKKPRNIFTTTANAQPGTI